MANFNTNAIESALFVAITEETNLGSFRNDTLNIVAKLMLCALLLPKLEWFVGLLVEPLGGDVR